METVLVVDDDADMLALVVRILTVGQFRVASADSGLSALHIADAFDGKIDVLVSDVEMPEMKGPDLVEILKKVRPSIQVILMCGSRDGHVLAVNNGWAFIQKPFAPKQLIEKINEVLGRPETSPNA